MERQKFEDAFKDAFKEAEVNPSEGVWTNIELDLEKEESGRMKRRLLFYKLLAAASVAFAMSVAGVGYYTMTTGQAGLNQVVQLDDRSSAGQDSNEYSSQPSSREQSLAQRSTDHSSRTSPDNSHDNGDKVVDDDDHHSIALNDVGAEKSASSATGKDSRTSETPSSNSSEADQLRSGRSASGASGQDRSAAQSGQETIAYEGNPAGRSQGTIRSGSNTGDYRVASGDKTITGRGSQPGEGNTSSAEGQSGNTGSFAGVTGQGTDDKQQRAEDLFGGRPMPAISNSNKAIALNFEKKEEVVADPVALMFARLAEHERELARQGEEEEKSKDKDNKKEKLWTSVGFAAGGFNTVNSKVTTDPGASLMSSAANDVASEQAKASGVTYSVGVSMGTQLSKRWVLQGGVNYLTQQSDYTATGAVGSADFSSFKAASLNELDKLQTADARQENKIVPTAPYSVNNNVQFLSVPLQAGYLIINRKLGLQLNAGVSTDLFLQNTINPEGGSLDETTQGRGADSPYRSINFSGLVGTELSYKFGSRYRVALNPGLRYPFNSIYKSDLGVEATPLTFDVGLRFRYIFR
jgi:hypothetical protein